MIKLTFCLIRLPHLTREAFLDYWINSHARLVNSVRGPLRIQRYVQLHSLPDDVSEEIRASRDAPEGYDGVAQLWWRHMEDVRAVAQDEEGRRAGRMLLEDEKRFIDLSRSPLWWGEDKAIF